MTTSELDLTVTGVREVCTDTREVVLARPSGDRLPSFAPGSHIAVACGNGRRNSYSLTGPAIEPDAYSISVRLDRSGRGGSRWIHGLRVGDAIRIGLPRNAFPPVAPGRHHLYVAGGIGVTPILSHVRAAVHWERSFRVIYAHRPGYGAHLEELRELCGDRLATVSGAAGLRDLLGPLLTDQPLGTHLYVCGPGALIRAVTAGAQAAGWPNERVHSEAFSAPEPEPGTAFTATLRRSGGDIAVGATVSLLEALLDKGIDVPNLCRQGICGECRIPVRAGRIRHRDTYLTAAERATGDALMPCVSRAADDRLELDL